MSRRQRRAQKAHERGRAGFNPGPEYLQTVKCMAAELQTMVPAPRFRLPPSDAGIIGGIDQLREELAGDEATARLIDRFCAMGVRIGGGPGCVPTVNMLAVAIDLAGIRCERMPLEHFTHGAPTFPIGPGSRSRN